MTEEEARRARARAQKRRRQKRHKRSRLSGYNVIIMLLLCAVMPLLLSNAAAAGTNSAIEVTLQPESLSIIQEEERPPMTAKATCEEDATEELSEGFTVQDLLDELNQGIGYSLICDGDGKEEGTFPIKVELTSDLSTPLYSEWLGKVNLVIREGSLEVKNKFGEWDGDKFKRWDGTYVTNDFISYHGKQYYFDGDGKRMTGWQEIGGMRYHFDDKGAMSVGWFDADDGNGKYFFNEDGSMHVGWLDEGEDRYYFGQDGLMYTGDQKVGSRAATFAEDGKLVTIEPGVDPNLPMIALTFDDGPGPRTMELLEALEKYEAHATFFMQGVNVPSYPEAPKKMLEIGCELGNHSYDHPQLTTLDAAGIQKQIGDTNSLIAEACGQPATVMRPPYGSVDDTVSANVGMPMIIWSIDTLDWKTRDVQANLEALMSVGDGDIILMHDIHDQSVEAAIQAIPQLQAKGFQLVTISEMAEARGITLENGGRYSQFWKE